MASLCGRRHLYLRNRYIIIHCTAHVANTSKQFRNNRRPLSSIQFENTYLRLPYLHSAAQFIRQAAQIGQINANSVSIVIRHAEKFYTAVVIRVCLFVFCQSTRPIIGIREPTPFTGIISLIQWKLHTPLTKFI